MMNVARSRSARSIASWGGFAVLVFYVAGCTSWKLSEPETATVHPFLPQPAHLAKVCVIRTSVLEKGVTFVSRDNGVLVGATRGASYFCYYAEPGDHDLAIEAEVESSAKLRARPGESYYLKEEVAVLRGKVQGRGVWVDEAVARNMVDDSSYVLLVGAPGRERVPGDLPFAPAKRQLEQLEQLGGSSANDG
ncbi:hypothetical protein [Pendulispora albinea]|uniref:DUF2846 domain-containing protein n=1 Tax=Pendulispora albinea TaxID=2741071 RepID=A0ABZ2M5T0_9BACT